MVGQARPGTGRRRCSERCLFMANSLRRSLNRIFTRRTDFFRCPTRQREAPPSVVVSPLFLFFHFFCVSYLFFFFHPLPCFLFFVFFFWFSLLGLGLGLGPGAAPGRFLLSVAGLESHLGVTEMYGWSHWDVNTQ